MALNINEMLGDDARYVDENSAIALSACPANAWPALVEALDHLSGGATEPGIDCLVATTHETLDDFDVSRTQHWSERGKRTEHIVGGYQAVLYERFQLRRGTERRDQIIVDFGDARIALYR